jgi:hypothetical protein
MIARMRQVLFALLCFMLVHTCLKAEGLSFTDRNKDEMCGAGPYCSDVQIRQSERGRMDDGAKRQFTLRALITLYPNSSSGDDATVASKIADVRSVDVAVVVETADLLKHEFTRRSLPIRVQGKGENAIRYCELEFYVPFYEILTVDVMDASEKDRKGNVIFRHRFK